MFGYPFGSDITFLDLESLFLLTQYRWVFWLDSRSGFFWVTGQMPSILNTTSDVQSIT